MLKDEPQPPSLPQTDQRIEVVKPLHISLEGVNFDPDSEHWNLRDSTTTFSVDWERISVSATQALMAELKKAVQWYVEQRSLSHVKNICTMLYAFLEATAEHTQKKAGEISATSLTNYRAKLGKRHEWKLGVLSGFFQKWHRLGYGGVPHNSYQLLSEWTFKGNPKGNAVLTHDPRKGPFTECEVHSIQSALSAALAAGTLTLRIYVLSILHLALGSRAVQFAALKVKDLLIDFTEDGTKSYVLNVPRAKQRLETSRSQFKARALIPEIGETVEALIAEVEREYGTRSQGTLDRGDLPLFPSWDAPSRPGFEHHSTSSELGAELTTLLKEVGARSERTNGPIHITPRRFRYTVGTRAAEEGFGELVIAELLDQSDIQQVAVYVKATPLIVERIDKALAHQLAPRAQAFAGQLIADEGHAIRAGDATSRIRDPGTDCNVGNCGKYGFCAARAPVACYTCKSFQPWFDAPHEAVLDLLLNDRDRIFAMTKDHRIAGVNDRTILAVAQVIQLCAARRAGG